MRGHDVEGRFGVDFEMRSMQEGMTKDLHNKVGQDVNWFRWQEWYKEDTFDNMVDDIYDVSSAVEGGGRRWMLPIKMPALLAQVTRGANIMNERGFYVVDTMRLLLNSGDLERLIPEVLGDEPNDFIRDRIVYKGQVFAPIRVNPRGLVGDDFAVVSIDCTEVNRDELVNDPQFAQFAQSTKLTGRS